MNFPIFITGFTSSFVQIVAIGAQNTFVLRSGLEKTSIFLVPLICAICDILLITLSIFGVADFVVKNPYLMLFFKYFGAIFLFWYGINSIKSGILGGKKFDENTGKIKENSLILGALFVSIINPHCWLDTVVIIGALATEYPDSIERFWFYIGSISASIIWFFSLAIMARFLAPIFKNPLSWQILDLLIGIFMFILCGKLLIN